MPTITNLVELANSTNQTFNQTFIEGLDTIFQHPLKDIKDTLEKRDEVILLELYKQLGEKAKTTFEQKYGNKKLAGKKRKTTAISALCSLALSLTNNSPTTETDLLFQTQPNVTLEDPVVGVEETHKCVAREELNSVMVFVTKLTTSFETLQKQVNKEIAEIKVTVSTLCNQQAPANVETAVADDTEVSTDETLNDVVDGENNNDEEEDGHIPPSGTVTDPPQTETLAAAVAAEIPAVVVVAASAPAVADIGAVGAQLQALMTRLSEFEASLTKRVDTVSTLTKPTVIKVATTPVKQALDATKKTVTIQPASLTNDKVEQGTLYIGNVNSNATAIDMIQSITNLGVECLQTEPLNNGPKSRSFKVTVPEKQVSELISSSKWPKGIIVKRFQDKKKPSNGVNASEEVTITAASHKSSNHKNSYDPAERLYQQPFRRQSHRPAPSYNRRRPEKTFYSQSYRNYVPSYRHDAYAQYDSGDNEYSSYRGRQYPEEEDDWY